MADILIGLLTAAFVVCNLAAFALGQMNEDRSRKSLPWLQRSTSLQLVVIAAVVALTRSPGSLLGTFSWLIAGGMAVAFGADLVMASHIPSPARVVFGMLIFAIAHSLYIAGMLNGPAQQAQLGPGLFLATELALLAAGIIIWARFIREPKAPAVLNIGSLGYLMFLATMTALATALCLSDSRWWALSIGGLLFLASDAVLGNQLFRRNLWPYSSDVVWGLYIAGQAGIVLSTLVAGG